MGIDSFVMMMTLLMNTEINKKMIDSGKETFTREEVNTMTAEAATTVVEMTVQAKKKAKEKAKEDIEKVEDTKKAMEIMEKIHTGKIQ